MRCACGADDAEGLLRQMFRKLRFQMIDDKEYPLSHLSSLEVRKSHGRVM